MSEVKSRPSAASYSAPAANAGGERLFRRVLGVITVAVILLLGARFVWILWSQHAVTQVEAISAIHARDLANSGTFYYDLNSYPYTVSPYGPIWYGSLAALYKLGLPLLTAGRVLSFVSLLGILLVTWRILLLSTGDRYAAWTGLLFAASAANLSGWGTLSQSDAMALFFSVMAFYQYSLDRLRPKTSTLVWCGLAIAAAIFTKQSFLAAPAAIALLLFLQDRGRALRFVVVLGVCGTSAALALNAWTEGRYFDNAILSNLNPFSSRNLEQHATYLLFAGGSLVVIAASGLQRGLRGGIQPFYAYLCASLAILLATAPKVGSDLNYQLETMLLLSWCAAWSLHHLNFFPLLFRGDRGWVTLLQIPLLLHAAVNVLGTGNSLIERYGFEELRRAETAAFRPILNSTPGRVLSVQIDPLLQTGRQIIVEPLIYTLLVDAGVVDPGPVRRDLAAAKFDAVVLYQDLFSGAGPPPDLDVPSLPESHLDAIRKYYRLVGHVSGPLLGGTYVYAPLKADRRLLDAMP